MDWTLTIGLVVSAAAALTMALAVTVIKVVHGEVMRWRGVRTAHYIAAVGEMVSRRLLPASPPRSWAHDTYFHDVLSDYRLLLTGADREFIDRLATETGVHAVLVARCDARWLQARRLRALSSLVDLADERHVGDLRRYLGDSNRHVRINAVRGLARLGDKVSIEPILDLAAQSRSWEAARMADALAEMGSVAVEPICHWIAAAVARDEAPGVVALAARILGLIGDPEAEATLISLLESDRPDWRLAASSALEHTGSDAAVAPLLTALDDPAWSVRARAAVALGALADSSVGPSLALLLTDRVWWVRQNAAEALVGLPGGADILLDALDSPDRFAVDAALNQLTLSGLLGEASERVAHGSATARDQRLVEKAAGRV